MSSDSHTYLPDEIQPIKDEEIEDDKANLSILSTTSSSLSSTFSSKSKDFLYIIHKGIPTTDPSPFANCSNESKMPDNILNQGLLIYDVNDDIHCLPPPNNSLDTTLRFDSHFESGNLEKVYKIDEITYHLILELDKSPSGQCQWFYFQITNAKNYLTYKFYITGFHKNKSLYTTGAKIFWYSEKRAQDYNVSWTRGGENYTYGFLPGQKKKDKRATVSFDIKFPMNDDIIYLCYALPYTYSDLWRDIQKWQNYSPFLKVENLCETAGGRNCPILTITDEKGNIPIKERPYIFVTARIHPGESNGSFLMRGYMDFLLKPTPESTYIRQHYITKVVPMLNIDGVVEGFYRVSLSGHDLNRIWSNPDPKMHPEILQTKQLFSKIAKDHEVAMYLDFHGHSRLHGTFAFGCPNVKGSKENSEKIYPRILSYLCDTFSWQHCEFSYPEDRKSAGRIVVRKELNVIQSFTVETSFGGILAGSRAGMLYDQLLWEELGQQCCKALFCYSQGETNQYYHLAKQEIALIKPKKIIKRKQNKAASNNIPSQSFYEETPFNSFNKKSDLIPYDVSRCKKFLTIDADSITTEKPQKIQLRWIGFDSELA